MFGINNGTRYELQFLYAFRSPELTQYSQSVKTNIYIYHYDHTFQSDLWREQAKNGDEHWVLEIAQPKR